MSDAGDGIEEAAGIEDARRMWAADRASATLGMRLLDVGPGRALVAMVLRDDLLNGVGTGHGGVVATLADSAFAVACNTRGAVTVAAGFDITLLCAARPGDDLHADAREVALAGRSGIYDVTVRRGATPDADVIAEFRGRSRRLR